MAKLIQLQCVSVCSAFLIMSILSPWIHNCWVHDMHNSADCRFMCATSHPVVHNILSQRSTPSSWHYTAAGFGTSFCALSAFDQRRQLTRGWTLCTDGVINTGLLSQHFTNTIFPYSLTTLSLAPQPWPISVLSSNSFVAAFTWLFITVPVIYIFFYSM